ncbi:helix-turn-helix domain-containing protein [Desertibacillus haloalkaliphilus]|uniref:helix-turn-helix domain-containing protein n=1 Tax=Desertibacillus haloalkaliphilus TaxID=1328930 RepID=UPI001C27CAE3|nr:AraC family transcriptional regulator [Desertibacillus haloalkaliphilus]MBU8906523.1 AraC family transcriptional regulator [Desertibacillus haloalkaliphilus]
MSHSNHAENLLVMLHEITDLNVVLFQDSGVEVFREESVHFPEEVMKLYNADLNALFKLLLEKDSGVYEFDSTWQYKLLGKTIEVDGLRYVLIVGPFLIETIDVFQHSLERGLSHDQHLQLQFIAEQLPIISPMKMNAYGKLMSLEPTVFDENFKIHAIDTGEKKKNQDTPNQIVKMKETDIELIELRYKIEDQLLEQVKKGNSAEAERLVIESYNYFNFEERMPKQPIRLLKNLSIIFHTLVRREARNAKVPAILVHRTSEKFAREIEELKRVSEFEELRRRMIKTYADLSKSEALSGYSGTVRKVIEHLQVHFDRPLNKDELAEKCYVHPSHLSRKFKQETGMTVKEYQQKIRIERAIEILDNEKLSVEEVAWFIGYEDPSYFTRVFKNKTGLTPSDYRLRRTKTK